MSFVFNEEHKTVQLVGTQAIIQLSTDRELQRTACQITKQQYADNFQHTLTGLQAVCACMPAVSIIAIDPVQHQITYSMPRYDRFLLQELTRKSEHGAAWLAQIPNLLQELLRCNLVHDDIALRNIAIDQHNQLQWIDLDMVRAINDRDRVPDDYLLLAYIEADVPDSVLTQLQQVLDTELYTA